jgi:hypothetical protein
MGKGAYFFLGLVLGIVAASIWWNRTAIKAAYTNRDKIRAGLDLAANLNTLTS